jgi:hypothetical protein
MQKLAEALAAIASDGAETTEDIMSNFDKIMTEINSDEFVMKMYEDDKADINNLSYWFPKIKDVQNLNVPKTVTVPVPFEVFNALWDENLKGDPKVIIDFLGYNIVPHLRTETFKTCFMKNGRFSNKFQFSSCITDLNNLLENFLSINYAASCVGAGGVCELNIRELINFSDDIPAIYKGMPLRNEQRVFYDFDERKILYSVNYWEPEYVGKNLHDSEDKPVFDAATEQIIANYVKNKSRIDNAVAEAMKDVELTGQWSVDILVDDNDNLWLIDMAVAQRSAYWNKNYNKKAG